MKKEESQERLSALETKTKSLEEKAMHAGKEVKEAKNSRNKLDFALLDLRVEELETTLEDERREGRERRRNCAS